MKAPQKGRRIFPRFPVAEDVDREIRAHLEMCVEELVREGWDPEEARREAGCRFGNERRVRRRCRSVERGHRNRVRRIQVVGIVPSSMDFPSETELWFPAELTPKSLSL